MSEYELALVIDPAFSEAKLTDLNEKISLLLKDEKGKVTKKDSWGKRELAYPILKQKEAFFVFFTIEAPALSVGFNKKIKLTDGVLRYLLLKKKSKIKDTPERSPLPPRRNVGTRRGVASTGLNPDVTSG